MDVDDGMLAYPATEKMINDLLCELHDVDFVRALLQDGNRRHWLLQAWTAEVIYGLAFCPNEQYARRKRLSRALRRINGWSFALSLDLLQELRSHRPPALLALSAMSRLLYDGYRHPLPDSDESRMDEEGSILIAPKIRQAAREDRPVYVCGFAPEVCVRSHLRYALAKCIRWPEAQEPAAAQIGLMVHAVAEKRASCVIMSDRFHPIALERLKSACEFARVPWTSLDEVSMTSFRRALLELEQRI